MPELCGYSNCFRPFHKMRGFIPVCEFHYGHPKKWCDCHGYTGSIFVKKQEGGQAVKRIAHDGIPPKDKSSGILPTIL